MVRIGSGQTVSATSDYLDCTENRYRQHSNLHIRSDRLPDDEDDIDELYNTQDTANIDRQVSKKYGYSKLAMTQQSQSQGHSQGHSNNHRIDSESLQKKGFATA